MVTLLLLRRAVGLSSTAQRSGCSSRRFNAKSSTSSSPYKRELSKQQVEGSKDVINGSKPPSSTSSTPSGEGASVSGRNSGGNGGEGGGGGLFLPLLVLAGIGAGGAAYYNDMIPGLSMNDTPPKKVMQKEKELLQDVVEEVVSTKTESTSCSELTVTEEVKEAKKTVLPTGEEVVHKAVENAAARAAAESLEFVDSTASSSVPKVDIVSQPSVHDDMSRPTASIGNYEITFSIDPESELRSSRTAMATSAPIPINIDGSDYLVNIDSLTTPELRTRLVQLATEMSNRTKWEAARLNEFLTVKEREVEGRYLEILHKQRLEFESLLAQRLREQEDVITRHANAALAAKEEGIQTLMKATEDAREAEMKDMLTNETKIIATKLEADYEQRLQDELAQMKAVYATDLDEYCTKMTSLKDKLDSLEKRLEVSRDYESGSKRAHALSAAALALASKLEVGEAAAVELAALKGAAGDEGVIASAVGMIPSSAKGGVPTLAELQAKFDECYNIGREVSSCLPYWPLNFALFRQSLVLIIVETTFHLGCNGTRRSCWLRRTTPRHALREDIRPSLARCCAQDRRGGECGRWYIILGS